MTGRKRIKVTFNRPVIGWGVYLSSAFILQNGQIGLSTVELDDYNHDETLRFAVFEYNCPGYVQIELFSTASKPSTDSIMYISKIELETFA